MEVYSHASALFRQIPVPVPVMSTKLERVALPRNIDYILTVNTKVEDVGDSSFNDFHMIKGQLSDVIFLLPQLNGLRSRSFVTCEDALVDFNNYGLRFDKSALLRFTNTNFLFLPTDGKLKAYKLADDVSEQLDIIQAENVAELHTEGIMQWFDVLIHLLKSLAVSYFCTYYPSTDVLKSETWAEDMDKADPIGKREDHWSYIPTVPKSRIESKEKQLEYCEFHHRMDTCLQTESRTVRRMHEVYDQCPTNVVQDVLQSEKQPIKSETSDEEDQRKRPITRFKTDMKSQTSDEEDQRKRPITRFKTDKEEPRSVPKLPIKNYIMNQATMVSKKQEVLRDQSSYDPQALSIAMVFNDNIVSVGNRERPSLSALMLKGRLGVTNAHVDFTYKVGDKIQINTQTETWNAEIVSINELRDLLFFVLPSCSRQFRDLTAHMMPRGEIKDFSNLAGLMITRRKDVIVWRTLSLSMEKTISVEQRQRHGLLYSGTCTGMSYGTMLTERGDCGSPVLVLDPTRKHKLLGFHSAASAMTGLGTLLYADDLPEIGDFDNQAYDPNIVILQHQAIRRAEMDDYKLFKVLGVAELDGKPLKQFHPYTSMLYKSPFSGFMEHQYEPAILDMKDTRLPPGVSPYEEAMDKWSHEQPQVDMDELRYVTHCVGEYLAQKVFENNYKFGVLTKTEAINGLSSIPASNPIYLRSSAGYPFKHWEGVTKKMAFFSPDGPNGTYVIAKTPLGQKLNVCVDSLIETAKRGQRSAVVFCGTLKDEGLKLKKIYGEKRATRSFAGSPVDYTIAHRMYFHGAMAAIASIHDQVPPQVGIDPCSVDWHAMCKRLTSVSDHGFDVDFSSWDATVPRVFMEALPTVYNTIYQYCDPDYQPEDDKVRFNLHSVLHGPLVMYYDTVVQCPGGQVSGQPATSMDNCIVNMLYHYYIWRQLAKTHAPDKMGYTQFIKNVASAFYGDDDITTVSAECMSWFNLLTFQVEATKLGLVVTDAMKTTTTDLVPIKPLMQMNFLKRNFSRIGKFIVGALEDCVFAKMTSLSKIHKGHHYYEEPDNVQFDPQTITSTIDSALHEACLKGEDFYKRIVKHFQDCCKKYAIRYEFYPPWEEMVNASLGLSSNIKLRKLEMYAELDIENESAVSNHVIEHSSSSTRRFRNSGRKFRGKFDGPKSIDGGQSCSEAGSCNTWNAKQQHRPIHLHELPVHGFTNMVNCSIARNDHFPDTNSSFQNQHSGVIPLQNIQHLGRRISIPNETCRNRISCRRTGMGSHTTEHQAKLIDNNSRLHSVRMGYHRSQTVGINHDFNDRSKESHVPLPRFRRERSNNVWWILCPLCNDAAEYVVNRITTNQSNNLVTCRSIVHCCPNCSTSACNNNWWTRNSWIVVSKGNSMDRSIDGFSCKYSAHINFERNNINVWSCGLCGITIDRKIHATQCFPVDCCVQWSRKFTRSVSMGRQDYGTEATIVSPKYWTEDGNCTASQQCHVINHRNCTCVHITSINTTQCWNGKTIHSTGFNVRSVMRLQCINDIRCAYNTLFERINCGIQTSVQCSECEWWSGNSLNSTIDCMSNCSNDYCFDKPSSGNHDARYWIFVCSSRQSYWIRSCLFEVKFKWCDDSNPHKHSSVIRSSSVHNRTSWINSRYGSCSNKHIVCSKQSVVFDARQEKDETLLRSRGTKRKTPSKDGPLSNENERRGRKFRRTGCGRILMEIAAGAARDTEKLIASHDSFSLGNHHGAWGSGTNSTSFRDADSISLHSHEGPNLSNVTSGGHAGAHASWFDPPEYGSSGSSSVGSRASSREINEPNSSNVHDGGYQAPSSSRHELGDNMPNRVRTGRGSTFAPTRSAHSVGLAVPAAIHGAFNLAGTLGGAAISGNNAIKSQNNAFNNSMSAYNQVMNSKIGAYNQAGLPSYLAYGGGGGAGLPPTSQVQHGSSAYTSHIPGNPQSSAMTGSLSQQTAGWGNIL
nr:MAG: RNA-dependent RNA polymerase [Crogonang virus 23]